MTVTPDDSIRLRHLGIVLLSNLTKAATFTLLYGNDVTDALARLTQILLYQVYL